MPFFSELRALTRAQRNTFSACFLGLTLECAGSIAQVDVCA